MQCAICGCKNSMGFNLCYFGCYWLLEGWVGFNAQDRSNPGGTMFFANTEALKLWAEHRQSYTDMVATARSLGWSGREDAKETMVAEAPKGIIMVTAAEAVRRAKAAKVAQVIPGAKPKIKFLTNPANLTPAAQKNIADAIKRVQ